MALPTALSSPRSDGGRLDVVSVHEAYADFVCMTLQRFGVRPADLEDLVQEVFIVVHRRLHTFDGSSHVRTWLYAICMRVAAAHRRRAHHRHEQRTDGDDPLERAVDAGKSPEEAAVATEQRERLVAVLDAMDLEERALFVMFELDELPCSEIAEVLGIPLGTVYSRLHAARKSFQAAVTRVQARLERRRVKGGGS